MGKSEGVGVGGGGRGAGGVGGEGGGLGRGGGIRERENNKVMGTWKLFLLHNQDLSNAVNICVRAHIRTHAHTHTHTHTHCSFQHATFCNEANIFVVKIWSKKFPTDRSAGTPLWACDKASSTRVGDLGIAPHFPSWVTPATWKLLSQVATRPGTGIIGYELGLVFLVSVYWDTARYHAWSVVCISVWQYVNCFSRSVLEIHFMLLGC